VEAELDEPPRGLKPGMYGMVTVTLADFPQAVVVPTDVIRYHGSSPCVFCENRGLTERREVEIGYSDRSLTQIISGLTPQDRVLPDVPNSIDQPGVFTVHN
jgi:multidrug efflux pump subunit AcrA (membrane-fusion protein)